MRGDLQKRDPAAGRESQSMPVPGTAKAVRQLPAALALIDGEHYPPVVRAALDRLAASHRIVAALFLGGAEKLRG